MHRRPRVRGSTRDLGSQQGGLHEYSSDGAIELSNLLGQGRDDRRTRGTDSPPPALHRTPSSDARLPPDSHHPTHHPPLDVPPPALLPPHRCHPAAGAAPCQLAAFTPLCGRVVRQPASALAAVVVNTMADVGDAAAAPAAGPAPAADPAEGPSGRATPAGGPPAVIAAAASAAATLTATTADSAATAASIDGAPRLEDADSDADDALSVDDGGGSATGDAADATDGVPPPDPPAEGSTVRRPPPVYTPPDPLPAPGSDAAEAAIAAAVAAAGIATEADANTELADPSTLDYDIKCLDDKLAAASRKKTIGNTLFRLGAAKKAWKTYDSAFVLLYTAKEEWELMCAADRSRLTAFKGPLHLNRGIARLKAGDVKNAHWDFSEALRIDGTSVKAKYWRGTVLLRMMQEGMAREAAGEWWDMDKAAENERAAFADLRDACVAAPADRGVRAALEELRTAGRELRVMEAAAARARRRMYAKFVSGLDAANRRESASGGQGGGTAGGNVAGEASLAGMPPLEKVRV